MNTWAPCEGEHASKKPADLYCLNCKSYQCNSCFGSEHDSNIRRRHQRANAADYWQYSIDLHHIPEDTDYENDRHENLFISVEFNPLNGKAKQNLLLGSKFYTLDIQDDDPMPIISFVGPTGAGKSKMLRTLVKEGTNQPIPSKLKGTKSSSADIHAYIGQCGLKTTLLLDCEGSGGTIPKSLTAIRKRFHEFFLRDRKPYVDIAYPRLLYTFSDVFIFVCTNSPKEVDSVNGVIEKYGRMAAAKTINQATIPVLIIIFNKIMLAEGEWDVTKASENYRKSDSLKVLFRNIYAVHFPDSEADYHNYFSQLQKLKEIICLEVEKAKLKKRETLSYFAMVAKHLSKDPKGPFDLLSLALLNKPFPTEFVEYLMEFFVLILQTTKKSAIENFAIATRAVADRIVDTFFHHMIRENKDITKIEINTIPPELKDVIGEVQKQMNTYQPCCAKSHEFPGVGKLICENSRDKHGEVHQSSESYTESKKDAFFRFIFGMKGPIAQTCRWPGEFQPTEFWNDNWLLNEAQKKFSEYQANTNEFAVKHRETLRKQYDGLPDISCSRVCAGCLLEAPSEKLRCGHTLCCKCCTENTQGDQISCLQCGKAALWKPVTMPNGAGFRILSMDGGGIRGVVLAAYLAAIEKKTGIKSYDLFDYIIGTSAGGLAALGIGVNKMSGKALIKSFRDLSQNAFDPVLLPDQAQYAWGYKYNREALHNTLEGFLPGKPLFGAPSLPKVAVVSCKLPSKPPELVFFTSYNGKRSKVTRVTESTDLEAAEATTAAGTYFPIFSTDYGFFTDGGIRCNNPCFVGYREAQALWHEKSLDILLSLGTGTFPEIGKTSDGHLIFKDYLVAIATNTQQAWDDLDDLKDVKGKAFRFQPNLGQTFKLDDYESTQIVLDIANDCIKQSQVAIDHVSNVLIAKLFYVDTNSPTTLLLSPGTDEKIFKIVTRIELPTKLKQFMSQEDLFSVTCSEDDVRVRMTENGSHVSLKGLPPSGSVQVSVYCHMGIGGTYLKEGNLISGCPIKLTTAN